MGDGFDGHGAGRVVVRSQGHLDPRRSFRRVAEPSRHHAERRAVGVGRRRGLPVRVGAGLSTPDGAAVPDGCRGRRRFRPATVVAILAITTGWGGSSISRRCSSTNRQRNWRRATSSPLQPKSFAGHWKVEQSRLYWSVKLPQGWWLWGIDTGLHNERPDDQGGVLRQGRRAPPARGPRRAVHPGSVVAAATEVPRRLHQAAQQARSTDCRCRGADAVVPVGRHPHVCPLPADRL